MLKRKGVKIKSNNKQSGVFEYLCLCFAFILIISSGSLQYAFAAAADMYVTNTGAGSMNGVDWSNAFNLAGFKNDYETAVESGDRYFFEEGTYTITSGFTEFADGTSTSPISFIGVASGTTAEPPTTADWAFGSNRPLFYSASGDYRFNTANFHSVYNMRWNTGGYYVVDLGGNNSWYNSSVTGSTSGNTMDAPGRFYAVGCQFENTGTGDVFDTGLYEGFVAYSYLKGSSSGNCIDASLGSSLVGNVFDSCSGVSALNDTVLILGNVFYNNTVGVSVASSTESVYIANNIFDNNTTAVEFTDLLNPTCFMDYNIWSNNTTDVTNEIETGRDKGPNSVTSNITFTDAANGDFTVDLTSYTDHEGVGLPIGTRIGLTGDYNINIGVDQTDTQSGGGGTTSYGFSN